MTVWVEARARPSFVWRSSDWHELAAHQRLWRSRGEDLGVDARGIVVDGPEPDPATRAERRQSKIAEFGARAS